MENSNLEETNPTRLPEEQNPSSQPGETLPVTIDEDEAEFANTVPIPTEIVPVGQPAPPSEALVQASSLEQTAPTPVPPLPVEPPVVERPPAAGRRSPSIRNRLVRLLDPARRVAVLDDGSEMPYDLFLAIPKHRVPDVRWQPAA